MWRSCQSFGSVVDHCGGPGWALWGLGDLWLVPVPRSCPFLPVRFFDAPQRESRLPLWHAPQGSRLQEPSTAVVQFPCRSVPRGVSLSFSLVCQPVLSLSGLPQLGPRTLAAVSLFHHPTVLPDPDKGHFYSVDSFIRQFKARQCSHPITLTRK